MDGRFKQALVRAVGLGYAGFFRCPSIFPYALSLHYTRWVALRCPDLLCIGEPYSGVKFHDLYMSDLY